MSKKNSLVFFFLLVIFFAISMTIVFSVDPTAPTELSVKSTSRKVIGDSSNVSSQGGNITNVDISQTQRTGFWQGYWGDVTGGITLDDSLNRTFYDWSSSGWGGEVYAVRGSVTSWNTIECANQTTMRNEEIALGISNPVQKDGVNETFNDSYSNSTGFYVSSVHINGTDNCPGTYVYSNEARDENLWNQILLYEPNSNQVVYTTPIYSNSVAYANTTLTADFQLLVGANDTVMLYYFYIDLS